MINGIKCSGKIKKTETTNLLLAAGSDEIIMNSEKSSFCRMEFGIGRLKWVEKIVFCWKNQWGEVQLHVRSLSLERKKIKSRDRYVDSSFLSALDFLRRGCTELDLNSSGKTPEARERLMIVYTVMVVRRTQELFLTE
jgi:hypothetical protein